MAGIFNYWVCPNSGNVITSAPSDNKASCNCGKVNPNLPNKFIREVFFDGGVTAHFTFALKAATRAEFVKQRTVRRVRYTKSTPYAGWLLMEPMPPLGEDV